MPRRTGDVRFGDDVTVRMLALSEQAAPRLVGQRHAAEVIAVDVGDAVVARQPFVDERVVGGQQFEQAAILPHDAADEQLRFAAERAPQIVVELGKAPAIRLELRDVAQMQPLAGKVVHERRGPRVRQHPPHLLIQHRRILQPAALGELQQLIVGNAAPQEERQPRRQLEIAHPVVLRCGAARPHPARCGTGTTD